MDRTPVTASDLDLLDADLATGRLLPGGALALARLESAFAAFEREGSGTLVLPEAWMLRALPQRDGWLASLAATGRLQVARQWVRLDPYALPAFRPANHALADAAMLVVPGALALVGEPADAGPEAEARHAARAGLCLEHRRLADLLAAGLGSGPPAAGSAGAVLAAALRALAPAGIGGLGDADSEAEALAVLRSACRALGLEAPSRPSLTLTAPPPRARHLSLGGPELLVEWTRANGLTWQWPGGRPAASLLSLEVQGDAGGRGAFVASAPPRPRVFEVASMRVVETSVGGEWRGALFERELRLPVDAEAPRGVLQRVTWRLRLSVDPARRCLDISVEISAPVPGHRYRLWLPVPFWPRPARLAAIGADGIVRAREHSGPLPPSPVMPPVSLTGEMGTIQIGGPGLREIEILPRRNDHVCAVTLLRAPKGEAPPARVVRELRVAFAPAG